MKDYELKWGQELLWAALVAVVAAVLQILKSTDPSAVTDWKTYAAALGIAAARAAAAAVWNVLSPNPSPNGGIHA